MHTNSDHLNRRDVLLLLSLAGIVVIVFWRLALTNLIIGSGDLFFYFYPYRDYASEAVRSGRVPLWNPYSFMGVPFLANSQAGFLYPLNLALAWLPVERMVNASIVLHSALAAMGAFLWGRRGLGLGRPAAWLTGLCFGLGGYFLAQVEHLNQVQVLAWLPWLLWVYTWQKPRRFTPMSDAAWSGVHTMVLGLIIALQFLAGHTQSVFICLVGLAGYTFLPTSWEVIRGRSVWRELVRPSAIVAGAAILGGVLAAVQLLPTLELSRLSIRSGGLPYKEAVSFSLRPELVGRALLPSWGAALFPEFVAYVGIVGLGLAVVAVWADWWEEKARRSVDRRQASAAMSRQIFLARRGALVLVVLGFFLALGGYNPVYVLLVKLAPGFDLFRAPARWLALYAIGVSGLAGIGLEMIAAQVEAKDDECVQAGHDRHSRSLWMTLAVAGGLLGASVLVGHIVAGDSVPDLAPPLVLRSVVGWVLAAVAFGALIYFGVVSRRLRSVRGLTLLLLLLVVIELMLASVFLPFNRATVPEALTSLRPAVAHLLGEANATVQGPPARFLSISDIFFDPGDKPEIEIILNPQLSKDAVYDYIIATKQKEVLIPNLPLYYGLPAMDGYDGGVLPLRRYVTLERLYLPEESVAIDGRLRENLEEVPDGRWLSLFNVRYIITDKVRDAWFDDVFYDLQMGATLGAHEEAKAGYVPVLPATALGVVYQADGAAQGASLADVDVTFEDGAEITLPLIADGADVGDRVARLSWGNASAPAAINVRGVWDTGQVSIRGLSLIDERTGAFLPVVVSDSGHFRLVHSGDVKIYENLDLMPRLFFAPQALLVPDGETALNAMRDPAFDPQKSVVLEDSVTLGDASPFAGSQPSVGHGAEIEVLSYEPEKVVATVVAPSDGWLVLSDAWYPGWEATLDGNPVPVERANVLFRAIAVPAGTHHIELLFQPTSFRLGAAISLVAFGLLLLCLTWLLIARKATGKAQGVITESSSD